MNRKRFIAMCIMACFALISGVSIAQTTTTVPEGQKTKVLGYITQRSEEKMVVKALDGSFYAVELTSGTSVKSNTKGIFRGGTTYGPTFLLRGLRVEVEGRGNAAGAIQADSVRFNETDLRSAQTLETRMDPVEQQVSANTENIKRQAGQIEENTALANRAQASADAAMKEAERANNRINGLGEYDPIKTIIVPFATGSATIGPKGRAIIDEAAAWVKTQDRTGWMVSVVGFADSTGKTAANKRLSERRANAVIGYLVSKYNLPLTKLVQPFGAGVDDPVATNETSEGRAANRRVEIRLLRNKGIAGTN